MRERSEGRESEGERERGNEEKKTEEERQRAQRSGCVGAVARDFGSSESERARCEREQVPAADCADPSMVSEPSEYRARALEWRARAKTEVGGRAVERTS